MAVTTLEPDSSVRIDHAIAVAVHPDTRVPTRVSTRPYRFRRRWPKGWLPRDTGWSYRCYRYEESRDKEVAWDLRHGHEVQVWDFPDAPFGKPVFKDPRAVAKLLTERREGAMAVGPDGHYWVFRNGEWGP